MQATPDRWPPGRLLWLLLGALVLARLATLGLYPIMDQTEARYAEIGRKMVELGDWVTPWIDYGQPFWGKPPFSFWITALSFELFGVNAFAARLPHLLCGVLVAWVIWDWLSRRDRREAIFGVVLLCGSALFLVSAGAVMTDMSLVLGTTLAMRGFWLGLHGNETERSREQYLFFVGVAIGLLAKGPIAAVLAGLPIVVWSLVSGGPMRVLREFRWVRGILLTLLLVAPWYVWAELRSPGFIEYFLIGEHWHRFVTPGWQGDLYGSAHAFPRGSIWLFAVAAFLPWSVLVPAGVWRWRNKLDGAVPDDRPLRIYLLLWASIPCVFFTMAGNILWTYVLPGLPALSILAALWLARVPGRLAVERLLAGGLGFTLVLLVAAVTAVNFSQISVESSAQALVADYESNRMKGEGLVYLGRRPYSAAFYSGGLAEEVRDVDELIERMRPGRVFVAMDADDVGNLPAFVQKRLGPVSRRGGYQLLYVRPAPEESGPEAGAPAPSGVPADSGT